MTQVEFHTGVADTVHFACRLLRKAYRQGERLLVTAPAHTLEALDRALWTFAAQEFIPHRRMGADLPSPPVVKREQVKPGTFVSIVTRTLSSYLRALLSHVLDCSYTRPVPT